MVISINHRGVFCLLVLRVAMIFEMVPSLVDVTGVSGMGEGQLRVDFPKKRGAAISISARRAGRRIWANRRVFPNVGEF